MTQVAPLRRKQIGSYTPEIDTGNARLVKCNIADGVEAIRALEGRWLCDYGLDGLDALLR